MRPSERRYTALLFAVSFAAFFLTFHFFGQPVEPGLDASWKYAQNRFFTDGIRPGRDVIGTYGPFGFLVNTMPLGENMRISFWFEVALRLALVLTFVFLFLGDRERRTVDRIVPAILLGLLLATVNRGEKTPGFELVALAAGLILTAYRRRSNAALAAAVVTSAIAFLIKFSIGVLCLTFPAVFALWVLGRDKSYGAAALAVFGPVLLTVALWLAFYGDLHGFGDYVRGSLEESRGYSSAMTSINAPDAPGWIAAALAVIAALLYWLRRERDQLFPLLLLLPGLLISIKYGVTKQPQFLFQYALFLLLLMGGQARTLVRQVAVVAALSLCIFFLELDTNFLTVGAFRFDASEPVIKPLDLSGTLQQFTNLAGYTQSLRYESGRLLDPVRLSRGIRQTIGNGSVDTYPWEISIIPANGLNWRPRPVFQSYFSYTPWLDRRNERFFRSGSAPEYLLWDAFRADTLASIDGRYLLNDEPLTIVQVLGRYDYIGEDNNIVVFRKRASSKFREPIVIARTDGLSWNKTFPVPPSTEGILRARLRFERTFLGRLRLLFYKESPTFIEYFFDTGEYARCRLVLDNAVSGIWVNPFIPSLFHPDATKRVVALRIENPDAAAGSFSPQLSVEWELISPNGAPARAGH